MKKKVPFQILNTSNFGVNVIKMNVIKMNTIEVRKITPPNVKYTNLGRKILCHRPVRIGSPNMSVEFKDGKILAHNYGHGGSGWTLGPGSASYVNDLLVKFKDIPDLKKNTLITIIGAGVLGFFTAYDLLERGFTNITIIAKKFNVITTSHNAGGLLAPVSMDNDPEFQKIIDQIGINAYKFYSDIAQKKHKHFKGGAKILPTYFETREDSGLEPYVTEKIMKPAKDVILDFGNGTTKNMVAYDDGIFMDTEEMMKDLEKFLRKKNINFVEKNIESFDEVEGKIIINCTGLGSSKLNKDDKMISVQGHLILLKDQIPKDLQYMLLVYFDEDKTESGQTVKRSFYIFPKKSINACPNEIGVIGGTFIKGATPETPNEKEFNIILNQARNFYGLSKLH